MHALFCWKSLEIFVYVIDHLSDFFETVLNSCSFDEESHVCAAVTWHVNSQRLSKLVTVHRGYREVLNDPNVQKHCWTFVQLHQILIRKWRRFVISLDQHSNIVFFHLDRQHVHPWCSKRNKNNIRHVR